MTGDDLIRVVHVSSIQKARFPLEEKQSLDLFAALNDLRKEFSLRQCWYDDQFKGGRLVLKYEHFTITFFYTGSIVICGLVSQKELSETLQSLWRDFFKKNTK